MGYCNSTPPNVTFPVTILLDDRHFVEIESSRLVGARRPRGTPKARQILEVGAGSRIGVTWLDVRKRKESLTRHHHKQQEACSSSLAQAALFINRMLLVIIVDMVSTRVRKRQASMKRISLRLLSRVRLPVHRTQFHRKH